MESLRLWKKWPVSGLSQSMAYFEFVCIYITAIKNVLVLSRFLVLSEYVSTGTNLKLSIALLPHNTDIHFIYRIYGCKFQQLPLQKRPLLIGDHFLYQYVCVCCALSWEDPPPPTHTQTHTIYRNRKHAWMFSVEHYWCMSLTLDCPLLWHVGHNGIMCTRPSLTSGESREVAACVYEGMQIQISTKAIGVER